MSAHSVLLVFVCGVTMFGCMGSGAVPPIPVDAADPDTGVAGEDAGMELPFGIPDASFTGCEPYIAALAECPYQWLLPEEGCPRAPCVPGPCATDADCPALAGAGAGERCVLGNCAWCWQDAECGTGRLCRAGRCIAREDPACPATPACDGEECNLVSISEVPCPVCLCEGPFHRPCASDDECLPISSYKYRRCVYGRCAECRNDDDCDGPPCLPPGVCRTASTHPSVIYGTWLIGWPGGYNHYSLFRFEPDGTLRRGHLPEDPVWPDDIPPFPCDPEAPGQWPVLGTWEPVDGGALRVRLTSGVPCDGPAWSQEFRVLVSDDGDGLTLLGAEAGGQSLGGMRLPVATCDPAFVECELPEPW
ncbi:MAG: hypothetical protein ABIK09_09680 [Pseudomonadota bacterium]